MGSKGRSHPMRSIRRNRKSGHPAYVYHQRGHYYENIGITHDGKNGNIPLDVNPEPGNTTTAYIKPFPEIHREEDLKEVLPDWKIAESDMPKIERVKQRLPKPSRKNGK